MVGFGDHAVGFQGALEFEAVSSPCSLFGGEEGGSIGEVVEEKEGDNSNGDSEEALYDKSE
jgi:hypothetical protein